MEQIKDCPFCGRKTPDDLEDTLYPSGGYWRETDGMRHYVSHRERKPGDSQCWTMHCGVGGWRCGAQITADTREEAIAAWNRRAALQQAAGAVPEGCRIVPMEPSKAMLDRAVAFALNVSLGGSYGWTDYMRDLYARMLSAVPSKAGSSVHLGGGEVGGVRDATGPIVIKPGVLCAICGLGRHVACHRQILSGPRMGEALDHPFTIDTETL